MLTVAVTVGTVLAVAALLAHSAGFRAGRHAERTRTNRLVHDTVLQTLEAVALLTTSRSVDAHATLADIRRMAIGQASELRRRITDVDGAPGADGPVGLGDELATLVADMARDGLAAELSVAGVDDPVLPPRSRAAVRDAVREALRNTMKHGGTNEVAVRAERRSGGVAVIVRDQGAGFDMATARLGFGIGQSIIARLADVGGTATIVSRPGEGTSVTLWVPRRRPRILTRVPRPTSR